MSIEITHIILENGKSTFTMPHEKTVENDLELEDYRKEMQKETGAKSIRFISTIIPSKHIAPKTIESALEMKLKALSANIKHRVIPENVKELIKIT